MFQEIILACTLVLGAAEQPGTINMSCGSKVHGFEVVRVDAENGDVHWTLVLSQRELEEYARKMEAARRRRMP